MLDLRLNLRGIVATEMKLLQNLAVFLLFKRPKRFIFTVTQFLCRVE